jgi:predicted  nucleic acid-binding Zn-ribbon protein
MTKSSIVQLGTNSANTSYNGLLVQAKKQEIDKLNARIEELKRHRRDLERDIKTLLETKEAIEQSIKNIPPNRTMDELKM